jgi:hypothetical protein
MPRSYGDKFLVELKDGDPTRLGVKLGRLCVEANLPAAYVAKALGTSRTTVYAWFRGQGVREEKRIRIEAFISLVENDMSQGVLPARNSIDAKIYISGMLGGASLS